MKNQDIQYIDITEGKFRFRKETYRRLIEEAKDFGIYNKQGRSTNSGKPSISQIVKMIIVSYKDIFIQKEYSYHKGKEDLVKVSYTTNKNDDDFYNAMVFINRQKEENSEYVRTLVESYFEYPKYKREQILFGKQYQKIEKAVEKGKKVYITTKKGSSIKVSPYKIISDPMERFNYVMNQGEDGGARKARLAYIKDVTISEEDAYFSPGSLNVFEQMEEHGVLYRYSNFECENIVVRFTDAGYDRYKRSSLHKPIPIHKEYVYYFEKINNKELLDSSFILKIQDEFVSIQFDQSLKSRFIKKMEKNKWVPFKHEYICTFDCSYDQISEFFLKFGEEIEILKPDNLRESFKNFYLKAANVYKS